MSAMKGYIESRIYDLMDQGCTFDEVVAKTGFPEDLVKAYFDKDFDVDHINIPFKEKTLKELLENRAKEEPDMIYCIGSHSSYFFCGTAKQALEDLPGINTRYIADAAKALGKATTSIPKLKEALKREEERLTVIFETGTEDEFNEQQENVNNYKSRLVAAKMVEELNQYYISEYSGKPLLSRGIKEFTTMADHHCDRIIVEGIEQGKYWLVDEYHSNDICITKNWRYTVNRPHDLHFKRSVKDWLEAHKKV